MKKYSMLSAFFLVLLSAVVSYGMVEVTVFDETFVRGKGKPLTDSLTFPGVEGTARIRVINGIAGGSKNKRISSATVTLNGEVIFTPSDFNKKVDSLEEMINLDEGDNTIDVLLKSKPRSQVTIQIIQVFDAKPSGVIGPEGGMIGNDDILIIIPPDVFKDEKEISIFTVDGSGPFSNLPVGLYFGGALFDVRITNYDNAYFDKNIMLIVPHSNENVLASYNEKINEVEILPCVGLSKDRKYAFYTTNHFSYIGRIFADINSMAGQEVTFHFWNDLLVGNWDPGFCAGISLFSSWFRYVYGFNSGLNSIGQQNFRRNIGSQAQNVVEGSWSDYIDRARRLPDDFHELDWAHFIAIYTNLACGKLPILTVGYRVGLVKQYHAVLVWKIEQIPQGYRLYIIDNNGAENLPFSWNGEIEENAYCDFNLLGLRFENVNYDNIYTVSSFGYSLENVAHFSQMEQIYQTIDADFDRILDDGDGSGQTGDNPCTGGNTSLCDDNCPNVSNSNQADSDSDGIGDACEGGLTDGLVAYYSFNDEDANDESSNGNDGTENGNVSYEPGVNGQAARFSEVGDNISVAASEDLQLSSWTITGWFNMAESPYDSGDLVKKDYDLHDTGAPFNFIVRIRNNGLNDNFVSRYEQCGSDTDYIVTSPETIQANVWYHFASVRDENTGKQAIYLNGVEVNSATQTSLPCANYQPLYIGGHNSYEQYQFIGLMDEIRIYNRVLPEAEIQALANQ